MAVIVETLRLVDGFTGPMRTITAATQAQASAMQAVNISAKRIIAIIRKIYKKAFFYIWSKDINF